MVKIVMKRTSMKSEKQEIRQLLKQLLPFSRWEYDGVLAELIEDHTGRTAVCLACGKILPVRGLREVEYYNSRVLAHTCQNLSATNPPAAWVRTSWRTLVAKKTALERLLQQVQIEEGEDE